MKRKFAFKLLSAIMALALLLGVCASSVSAFVEAESDANNATNEAIGFDSIDSEKIDDLAVVVESVIENAEALGVFLAENYELVYILSYAQLKEEGVIDEIKANLDDTYAALIAQAEKYESADSNSIYTTGRLALAAELRATADTVESIIAIVEMDMIDEDSRLLLADLCDSILQHGYTLINLASALGNLGVEYTDKLISDLLRAADTAAANIKAAAEAKIAELENKLHNAEESAKAAIRAEIEKVKGQLAADLAALDAQVDAQIASLRAELEANNVDVELITSVSKSLVGIAGQIVRNIDEEIVDYFRANLGDVYYDFASVVVDAAKQYIINGEAETLDEAIEILKTVIIAATKDAGEEACGVIEAFVNEAVKVTFTNGGDSYLVSLNGGSAYYAQLLAELLELGDDRIGFTNWNDIDYDMLAAADLITIGYDENELSGFAVSQLIGYLANYVDVDVRSNLLLYIDGLVSELEKNGLNLREYQDGATAELEAIIDEFVAGKEVCEMDWAAIVGSENLHYVDDARVAIREELIAAGVMETYVIELNVLDLIYDNVDSLDNPELTQIFKTVGRGFFERILGDSVIYTIEIPVVDSLVFAAESFLYNYVSFNVEYGKLIIDLQKINPEASVLLLGYYNAFDGLALDLGDVSVNVGDAYKIVSDISSLQPFLYALYYPNVAYVDITGAETVYDSYVKAGLADGDLMSFISLYISDSTITDISAEGQEYVLDQILKALIVNCLHEYDNACDVDCNRCGMIRDVADHAYSNPCDDTCNNCGGVRPVLGHVYDSCTDTKCNLCGESRPEGAHAFDGCTDAVCNKCDYTRPAGEHVFDGCVDSQCNLCGATRESANHVYDDCTDAGCNNCGYVRPSADHVYGGCTDTDCDYCGATREAGEHVYSGCTDSDCDNCGETRANVDHEYDNCSDTTCNKCDSVREAANHKFANACDKDCDVCGETREAAAHVYTDCVDADCNVCGQKRVQGEHTLADCEDTTCDTCGATVTAAGHTLGDWKVETEATTTKEGVEARSCKNCDYKETRAIPVIPGSGAGVTFAIVIGAIVVADIIAFAVYWFVIQKKTFADLTASFSKSKATNTSDAK